jgi:hypothetical protein
MKINCKYCNTEIENSTGKRLFCNDRCRASYNYRNKNYVEVNCEICKIPYKKSLRIGSKLRNWCRSCATAGKNSPTWKGGHEHWQEGKLGRDKDGLSWKIQRQLCRERDNYTCQDCGKHRDELGYIPHCDHEIPYRVSRSHALFNLKLRCRSCHKKIEATRIELWDGKTLGEYMREKIKTRVKENSLEYEVQLGS